MSKSDFYSNYDWFVRAEREVKSGKPELVSKFLRSYPPDAAQNVLHLLEVAATTFKFDESVLKGTKNEAYQQQRDYIWEEILKWLHARPRPSPEQHAAGKKKALNKLLEQDKKKKTAHILVEDVFELTLKSAHESNIHAHQIASRLWSDARFQDTLANNGALWRCAQSDYQILQPAIQQRLFEIHRDYEQLKRVLSQQDTSGVTALGISISHGRRNLIDLLGSALDLVKEPDDVHLFEDSCACDADGTPILHFILLTAQAYTAFAISGEAPAGQALKKIEQVRDIINLVTDFCHKTLCHQWSGKTVYKQAKEVDEEGVKAGECFGLAPLIKDLAFRYLEDHDLLHEALYKGADKPPEFALDLSDLSHSLNSFDGFVTEVEKYKPAWQFEDILLYLITPDLGKVNASIKEVFPELFWSSSTRDGINIPSSLRAPRGSPASRTMMRFTKWLRGDKQVKSIIELNIPDDHAWPLNEALVARELLQPFGVQKLDWRKLDLDIQTLLESEFSSPVSNEMKISDSLRQLKLYSSGNWATLHHWASKGGLLRFSNLSKVHITVVEPQHEEEEQFMTYPGENVRSAAVKTIYQNRMESYKVDFERILDETAEGLQPPGVPFELTISPSTCPWNIFTAEKSPDSFPSHKNPRFIDDIAPCEKFLGQLKHYQSNENAPELAECYRKMDEIRIAIIDNGTDKLRGTIHPNIEEGISFTKASLDGKRLLPWYTVQDPHGTQMAYLIRTVNPYCKLLPIRAGTVRDDIDPEFAVKAVDWACTKKVDIISISWTTKSKSVAMIRELKEAIKAAANSGILIFCSTADDRTEARTSIWPADCDQVIKVAASDPYGRALPDSERQVDVVVDGDRLTAHGPKYMKNHAEKVISGSSVATALAAGLASLCLCLIRMVNTPEQALELQDKTKILKLFDKMSEGKGADKILCPSKLFGSNFDILEENDQSPLPAALHKFKASEI